jgi:hypothetical protein
MHHPDSTDLVPSPLPPGSETSRSPSAPWLRQARLLHRSARSDQRCDCLPVLRRLKAAGLFDALSLPQLFHLRHQVQRKHVLHMLARERGAPHWEALRPQLTEAASAPWLAQQRLGAEGTAELHHWFATVAEAAEFAARHGGEVLRHGAHAAVLAEPAPSL